MAMIISRKKYDHMSIEHSVGQVVCFTEMYLRVVGIESPERQSFTFARLYPMDIP